MAIAIANGVDAVRMASAFLVHGGSQLGLIALRAALQTAIGLAFAFFTVQRSQPHRRAREPVALLACLVAMLAVVPVAGPNAHTPSVLLVSGDAIATAGSLWIFFSVLALGRCFGVLPEARGMVTRGPYGLVRHPVYLGEITAMSGLTLAAPAPGHVAVLAIFVAAQLARMRFEEAALSEAFSEYAAYAARTPRLVPRLLPRLRAPLPSSPLRHGAARQSGLRQSFE